MTLYELLRGTSLDQREAEILLLHVLDQTRAWLYAHSQEPASKNIKKRFRQMVSARIDGVPLAYLLGYRDFWNLRLRVNPSVLIPRRETEHLVEWALECLGTDAKKLLDLGTGSGAVALACKASSPRVAVTGSDISSQALDCARTNGRLLNLSIDWLAADWFEGIPAKLWHVIASNPPYMCEHDPHLTEGDLPSEPQRALRSGSNGLCAIKQIIDTAPKYLETDGWLLLEHGFDQAFVVSSLLRARGFDQVLTRRDWSGQERITGGKWKN